MNCKFSSCCAVCGHILEDDDPGYLLSAHPLTNRITIFRWARTRACTALPEGVRAACQPQHAIEVVVHWMATGALNLTFAQADQPRVSRHKNTFPFRTPQVGLCRQPFGELAINHETVRHLFEDNPTALISMLDCLLEALQRDQNVPPAKIPAAKVIAAKPRHLAAS